MQQVKRLVQIGAGKIGRGYIADLFHEGGFQMTFLDYSPELVDAMKKQGYYTIFKHHTDGTYSKVRIEDYLVFCTQTQYDECVEAISRTAYVSVNIFPGAVDSISNMLDDAIERRVARGD